MFADDLIFAFRFVHGNLAAGHDPQSVSRLEFQIAQRGPEHEAANLCGGVLQREEQMTGVPDLAVRQLALDPDFEEFGFEVITDLDGEFGDAQHTPLSNGWRRRFRVRLVLFEWQIKEIRHWRDRP